MVSSRFILVEFASVGSTQDEAKRLLPYFSLTPDVAIACIAQEQTKGRGRSGRTWASPKEKNLYLSLITAIPPRLLENPSLLSPIASLAVYKTLKQILGNTCRIKWPNDILADGKKISGCLIETAHFRDHPQELQLAAIIGIGVNVNMSEQECTTLIPDRAATSLSLMTNKTWSISELSRNIIHALLDEIQYAADHPLSALNQWIDSCSWIIGEDIATHLQDGKLLKGIVEGFSPQGGLIIQEAQTGTLHTIFSPL